MRSARLDRFVFFILGFGSRIPQDLHFKLSLFDSIDKVMNSPPVCNDFTAGLSGPVPNHAFSELPCGLAGLELGGKI